MSTPRWQGISPAIATKFHADESIDAEALKLTAGPTTPWKKTP